MGTSVFGGRCERGNRSDWLRAWRVRVRSGAGVTAGGADAVARAAGDADRPAIARAMRVAGRQAGE